MRKVSYFVDRIKDLVIQGGENIGCGEVEAALLEHPLVHEASVYAVPDERLGEEVGATLYTERDLSDEELRDFLSERLAKFKNSDLCMAASRTIAPHRWKNLQTRITQQAVARAGA